MSLFSSLAAMNVRLERIKRRVLQSAHAVCRAGVSGVRIQPSGLRGPAGKPPQSAKAFQGEESRCSQQSHPPLLCSICVTSRQQAISRPSQQLHLPTLVTLGRAPKAHLTPGMQLQQQRQLMCRLESVYGGLFASL